MLSQKPDPVVTKELCIITLTKIYCMTHAYQTLVREITTPTLPTFITSCLNLVSKPTQRSHGSAPSIDEVVFQSFTLLIPRHTTIYRPFISQIRLASRAYLAPTSSDSISVPTSTKKSVQRLNVILHLTAPKNTGGEEWAKAVRELIKNVHGTADLVFRAVVEDWESTAGYHAESVDVNRELQGGGTANEDLPVWNGIHAGTGRLSGLLELLAEYLKNDTTNPVAIPVGAIFDLINRMLSIPIPSSDTSSGLGGARLHPAVDRDEKDGLWAGLPQIYAAALSLVDAVAERLQESFISLAQGSFDQLTWVFAYGKHSPVFRLAAYRNAAQILKLVGSSFDRISGPKLSILIKACCHDLYSETESATTKLNAVGTTAKNLKGQGNGASHNADTYLRSIGDSPTSTSTRDVALAAAAGELLPLFMSHFPQQHLDISMRSLIERTSILSHNKEAMLASILNPFVGKNGRALATILPHLARDFASDSTVEILLRPRMPLVAHGILHSSRDAIDQMSDDEDYEMNADPTPLHDNLRAEAMRDDNIVTSQPGLAPIPSSHVAIPVEPLKVPSTSYQGTPITDNSNSAHTQDVNMDDDSSDSDESVHLEMQLDTDSESD